MFYAPASPYAAAAEGKARLFFPGGGPDDLGGHCDDPFAYHAGRPCGDPGVQSGGTVVTEAVSDAINSGEIQYNNLISLEKNTSGGIAAMQSNMAEFNRLQSAITQDILNRLGEMSDIDLVIPVGTLTGSALLAGRGPGFTVRMQTTGSCSARFENQFSHAGINQTTHSKIGRAHV